MRQAIFFSFLFFFCQSIKSQNSFNPLGEWRGSFPLYNGEEIPFNFSVRNDSLGKYVVYFINGSEEYYGGQLIQVKDSLQIWINQFDRLMTIGIKNNKILKGNWRRQTNGEDAYPIVVEQNNTQRFIWEKQTAPQNIAGKYEVVFTNDSGKQIKAVGLINQEGNKGGVTFLRPSGDSRYSYGSIQGTEFKFSLFIGYSPLLFTGSIEVDGSLKGIQQGLKSVQLIRAYKNEAAALPDPSTLTQLKNNQQPFNFSLPNITGKN